MRTAIVRLATRFAPRAYHFWFYHNAVWDRTSWMGVDTQKIPSDMWNYQEILFSLHPSLVIEFGTCRGGSTLFFASVMRQIGNTFKVVSVDIDHSQTSALTKSDLDVELLTMSSTDDRVKARLLEIRQQHPGPAFAILDSDHSKKHVLAEMISLRDVLKSGDYMVVEDAHFNGHPVVRSHGPGPFEAIEEYSSQFPQDYKHDTQREKKFGFTCATNGFLIRI